MPEQLTRHPDVTLQVLRSAGAQCGEGSPQQILVSCPAQRFCKLPGGEICVYGLDDAAAMTQMGAAQWQALAPLVAAQPPPAAPTGLPGQGLAIAGLALLIGLVVGVIAARLLAARR